MARVPPSLWRPLGGPVGWPPREGDRWDAGPSAPPQSPPLQHAQHMACAVVAPVPRRQGLGHSEKARRRPWLQQLSGAPGALRLLLPPTPSTHRALSQCSFLSSRTHSWEMVTCWGREHMGVPATAIIGDPGEPHSAAGRQLRALQHLARPTAPLHSAHGTARGLCACHCRWVENMLTMGLGLYHAPTQ